MFPFVLHNCMACATPLELVIHWLVKSCEICLSESEKKHLVFWLSPLCTGHCGWYSSWHLGLPKAQAKDKCSHYGSEPGPRGTTDSKGEGDHARHPYTSTASKEMVVARQMMWNSCAWPGSGTQMARMHILAHSLDAYCICDALILNLSLTKRYSVLHGTSRICWIIEGMHF